MFYIMTKNNWICVKLLVEDILTHILLTLLTFIVLPILQKKKKKSIHCRRFLFGINNDANFPFTSAINELQQYGEQNLGWNSRVRMATTNIHLLQFKN